MITDYDAIVCNFNTPRGKHYEFMNNLELLMWTDYDLSSYVENGLIDEDDKVVLAEIERRRVL
jgi:hypothetical protein